MTAGSGILHQEMPKGDARGRMHGFQLWANLPRSHKMTDPRYQDIKSPEIPEITDDDGTRVRVVCGDFWGKHGPVEGVAADPRYLDVWVPPLKRKTLPVETDRHAFAYVFEGSGNSARLQIRSACSPKKVRPTAAKSSSGRRTGNRSLVLFDSGDEVIVEAGRGRASASCSCRSHRERSPGTGPIVMNTSRNGCPPRPPRRSLHRPSRRGRANDCRSSTLTRISLRRPHLFR